MSPLHPLMAALEQQVPLTLLFDLRHPDGPDSEVIYLLEQHDLAWLTETAPAQRH